MKKLAFLLLLIAPYAKGYSQDSKIEKADWTPAWVSKLGYWVIESNAQIPDQSTIRFYNNSQLLVYQETITGVVINIRKRKVKMQLKKSLEQAISAHNEKQDFASNTILKNCFVRAKNK
ncbi:MAG TPA: hypothetical protein PK191_02655 [Niabella sp.]|nr:hypothetical protein [Niabella sp.]HOZ96773.1 hypothetical protein [Niabella sp.]HQW14750.1 hypothetical protein [Niabella sp.]HQX19998.1 hypothetical protein [Niabella sp.]HQX40618.1 hypothetical protein [Niabella sp.]